MIIDIHGHLGNINQAPFWAADARQLEDYCTEAGIDILCVSSAKSIMYDTVEGNRDLLAALKQTSKLRGYAVINPVFPETLDELKLLENEKIIGVKLHPDYHGYDISSKRIQKLLDPVMRNAGLILWHCSCMPGTGFADALEIAKLAANYPQTDFVLAHMAGIYQNPLYPYFPNQDKLEKVMELALDNVYVDTAHFLMYVYEGVMERMVELATADKIVFGTDCPLQASMQMRFALETIEKLAIPQPDKEKILYTNALKLLGGKA